MMTTSTNWRTTNSDDTIVEVGHSDGMGNWVTQDYPSLAGHGWDDELLPSGD
jgi:hypothetical protein